MLNVLYRLSDGSYPKIRFDDATKENCLKNFINNCTDPWEDTLIVYADNVKDETWNKIPSWIDHWNDVYCHDFSKFSTIRTNAGSSAGSFRLVFEEALKLNDKEIVWFQEDDYWHLKQSRQIMLEGIERADYVALYDHPDKYLPAIKGGNKFIDSDAGEITKVILTKSSHWKMTNSTTMTFAAKVKTLREDFEIWRKHTDGTYPRDFDAFIELRNKGRSLITPIPSLATHCMPEWAAPLIDWDTKIGKL